MSQPITSARSATAEIPCNPVAPNRPLKPALKVHLEAELQDAGRIRSSDGSECVGAESRAGVGYAGAVGVDGAARVGVIGVVEAVEALGTGLELQSLMQRDEFAESRVHVGVMRSVELIGPGLAIRSRRVCGER